MATQKTDEILETIAAYVCKDISFSAEAMQTASACLADALGCGILALKFPACKKLLGPIVPGTIVPNGCCIPGTGDILDPIRGAFNFGTMIRWLDFNDTWLAAEWGHPSDNIGGLLPLLDYLSRKNRAERIAVFTCRDLLIAMIKAYEIQGVLALKNSFNERGLDHVILVKVATAAVAAGLLGGNYSQVIDAISNAWIDLGPLRTYRHSPNTGSRKSWAAGDATSRGVQLAMMVMQGEMGYPLALSTDKWGFYDVIFEGVPLTINQPLGSYVMENILFKVAFPAEFHAQTAVEAAFELHHLLKGRLEDIKSINISTHAAAIRIIDKKGELKNPADRDHCLQYMVAIGILYGTLTAHHYEDRAAIDPRIDRLRAKMTVTEYPSYSVDYLDPAKRSIANSILIQFQNGSSLGPIAIEYPLGHRRRRKEGLPLLFNKFEENVGTLLPLGRVKQLLALFQNQKKLEAMTIPTFVEQFIVNSSSL
ncbi:MAG: bifunctional 2-methylcitrate dehydratase/aconitate hydratase [Parachlamydiaceae bacterium]|nr:bifunctional 2-methylcitrate dehydratase/aconitate hydratase [Parachlamydiaceae bacterium]